MNKAAYLASVQAGAGAGGVAGAVQPGDAGVAGAGSSVLGSAPAGGGTVGAGGTGGAAGGGGSGGGGGGSGNATGARAASSNPYGLSTAQVGSTIEVGLHLPETGAAPLPMGWQQDISVVEKWLDATPIYGRKVHFDVEDDGYDPTTGMAACKKILGGHPLIAVGWSMPEVEYDCSQLFSHAKIPYVARGGSPDILTAASPPLSYFLSMADDMQGKLAADYMMNRMGGAAKKIGQVWENDQPASPKAFVAEIKAKGGKVVVNDSSVPRQSDFTATITKLSQSGVQIVNLSVAPVDAIMIATQAQAQGYHPIWVGIGTNWNYNMTVQSAGMAIDGAISFSPWASIDSSAANAWKSVAQQYGIAQPDDIGEIVFGIGTYLRAALQKAGPALSTASLVAAMDSLQFNAPFWAPATYTSTNHRGPTSVAVFQADGQAKRWRQIAGFTGGF